MIVSYINSEQRDDCVRLTFIGRDADGKTRRPVIDLDEHDFAVLMSIAKAFRTEQRRRAARYRGRADTITNAGFPE